ncbi:MAG: 50S ribosomal protein L29 [Candidatus Yanofskybacteria bacterium RIFCSPHIGHO2_02_FULL_43_22]|uniref:Large ribosomal subunit protein uL29 n=1 Tax=Candidatus Yanofskybacteria bacterium RIFCSPHIGHO2_02_FULL_43_22 TaxID=1802681 RepID=A0A1F8FMI9_9BACT|nr:MAG: 50S ribosomal protein L29 [Candidatus Yanofskybacteria bacterium RIFCSPHIGHO2_02_FULL_43_22]
MKSEELKNKKSNELTTLLQEYKTKLAKLSFELEANTLKDTSQLKKTKKDIARILTLLKNQRLTTNN